MNFDSLEADRQNDPAVLKAGERRATPRFCAHAMATIYRESDAMRKGIPARLHDISVVGLGLTVDEVGLEPLEPVKIRLQNDVQRIDREVRGIVRHISGRDDEKHRVGIELSTPGDCTRFWSGCWRESALKVPI